ncbi:DNA polymerase III subunit alpha [Candidatus Kaiserbacteria bacterium RIFCSPHIGHO2_01_FULL_54_36]|uniref:DNA polymerase III subunit alpha n=1 Tax=Candidatus Kaiserbacteria bacterium RIFCSPHIGHO2_01_FULL_54_36 TaxID=1798482 RepID=A0A1F6CNU4_9BACT|nr:MAG: DNA polymerase III subunit alpha [Candidatus Kaiserbacteria bacterium RIFCSPHIGHO2_01_FULL_54_36]OGG75560.1 MAG: DNA polymerase III subunit alpha [Candidatus Kaiserbacteria bacterium RIFCSPLOWO2_01_FULL_54_22]
MLRADFVHLHTHSHYSLLEALPKIPDLVEAAKVDGQQALALTDNGNLYGAIEFYKECKENGIKPILGVDFFVAPRARAQKEHRVDDHPSRLVLLAKNMSGYQNLLQLVSKSHLEGFYYRPRIDRELIELHHEGLIAILPASGGEHAQTLRNGNKERAREILAWYKKIFGDDCFAEITRHPEIARHDEQTKAILELARGELIEPVAACETYYLQQEDALARELVNKIRTAGVFNRDFEQAAHDYSFASRARALELFADLPEAVENTVRIAELCELELKLGKAIFPTFPIPKSSSDDRELRVLAEHGIGERQMGDTPELHTRINYELKIIADKGYASYFLIVADLLRHARDSGIFTNTRGSAAGSLVSYLCGITTVDPIEFNMPFERFLNPERPSAPDIDMDIADNRRDELIEYVRRKYGEDKVAQVGTFGTMMARAAVRDVARAMGHPYAIGDRLAKLIPFGKQGFPVTIQRSLEDVPELAQVYKTDGDSREILDLARKIEGNARHVGVHAAGVVIAPTPIVDYSPIQIDPKGNHIITQYDMYSIADEYGGIGLLKFDILGLTNLSVLADSVARVSVRLGVDIDLDKIPLDDTKVYELLTRGETLGVFQMAGGGMTSYLKDLKPTVIHDINAMVALYRPGPMAFIPEYIERKKDPARVKYLDPRMEEILKPTYGVLIYQDDVMMIAVQLAGYSWGEADKFRKAMGKKIPKEMAAQKEKFIAGCGAGGMKKEAVQKLWEQIETFAAYGFNKAHAASYGNLAYKTAYMKANFPVDYMAALLTADAGDVEKIAEVVAECKRMGIKVWPPSVQESKGNFTVIDDTNIRFGLYSIKNFGTGVADSIITARLPAQAGESGGPFADIGNFLSRIADRNLNKKSLEALIQSGALDDLGERGQLLTNIDALLSYQREHMKAPTDQGSLFGAGNSKPAPLKLPTSAPATMEERLGWEKELLGLYVSGHPLDKHKRKFGDPKKTIKHAKEHLRGVETVIAGHIEETRINMTKAGERMGFMKIADYSDAIEMVVFPRVLKELESLLSLGACVAVKGKISERNGESSFVVERAKAL